METFIIVLWTALLFISIGLGFWINDDWYKLCDSMNEDWGEHCKDVNDTWYDICKKLEEENTKLKKELEQCKK